MVLDSVCLSDFHGYFVRGGEGERTENVPGVVSKIMGDYPKRPRTSNSERADDNISDFCPRHAIFTAMDRNTPPKHVLRR